MPTVADILKEHVTLDIESFDRLYLNGYVPILQTERQLTYFLTQHLSNHIASPALWGTITMILTSVPALLRSAPAFFLSG